jgi:hypothetical protein
MKEHYLLHLSSLKKKKSLLLWEMEQFKEL